VRANTAQQRMECGMGCLISEPGCDGQRRPREREKRLGQGIGLRARRRRSRMRRPIQCDFLPRPLITPGDSRK
jgi:hypothetical protein